MQDPPLNDIDLLTRIAADEQDAFTKLYFRYSPFIYNVIMIYIKDESQADDLLQNVFVRLWEKRQELPGVENLENYLFIITRNLTLNHLKRKVTERSMHRVLQRSMEHPADPTGTRIIESEYRRLLQEAIDALPTQQKQAFLMASEEALSYKQIAIRMELSMFTVKKHLELARKSVRTYLNQRLHGLSAGTILLISIALYNSCKNFLFI